MVSKAVLISSATVIVQARGAIWLNAIATVLFSVGGAVPVGCCVLYPYCMGVFGMFERKDMGLYEVPLSVSLLGFWIERYYVVDKSSFKHTREECESKRAYVL